MKKDLNLCISMIHTPDLTEHVSPGSKVCIFFHDIRCEKKHKDTEILNFSRKLLMHGIVYDNKDEVKHSCTAISRRQNAQRRKLEFDEDLQMKHRGEEKFCAPFDALLGFMIKEWSDAAGRKIFQLHQKSRKLFLQREKILP